MLLGCQPPSQCRLLSLLITIEKEAGVQEILSEWTKHLAEGKVNQNSKAK